MIEILTRGPYYNRQPNWGQIDPEVTETDDDLETVHKKLTTEEPRCIDHVDDVPEHRLRFYYRYYTLADGTQCMEEIEVRY